MIALARTFDVSFLENVKEDGASLGGHYGALEVSFAFMLHWSARRARVAGAAEDSAGQPADRMLGLMLCWRLSDVEPSRQGERGE